MRAQHSLQKCAGFSGCGRCITLPAGPCLRSSLPNTLWPSQHIAPVSTCSSNAACTAHHRARVAVNGVVSTSTVTVRDISPQDSVVKKQAPWPAGGSSSSSRAVSVGPASLRPGAGSSSAASGSRSEPEAGAGQRWRLLSSSPLAGGVLQVVQWEGPRCIRVWLPPGYSKEEGLKHPWPALFCNDGQNMFGDCQTLSGNSWRAAHTASALISAGRLPPFLVVGLDHAGPLRSFEYTPYTPGTGPGGFRSDAAQWPGGGVAAYLARLQQEVLPWVAGEYGTSLAPADLAFAGSSFGGVAALAAGMSVGVGGGPAFGALLVESPSMWIAEEAFLKDISAYSGQWPTRVYIGMGGREYSGVRGGRGAEHDAHFPRYLKALYASLTEQGLGPDRLAWTYDPTAAHTEAAWAQRLPEALSFVGQGWWAGALARSAERRLITSPGQLVAGVEGQLLFFNRGGSSALRGLPRGSGLKVMMGVDGWQQVQTLLLEPLGSGLSHQIAPPRQLQQEVFEAWGFDPAHQEQLHQRLLETVQRRGRTAADRGAGGSASAGAAATAGGRSQDDWCVLQLPPPPLGCSRLDMAFCDLAEEVWDNNDRQDFHLSVSPQPPAGQPGLSHPSAGLSRGTSRGGGTVALTALVPSTPQGVAAGPTAAAAAVTAQQSQAAAPQGPVGTVVRLLDALRTAAIGDGCGFICPDALNRAEQQVLHGANAPAHNAAAAAEAAGQLMFTMPQQPVAGLSVSLYVNKAALQDVLKRAPNMCLQVGFNQWSTGVQKVPFRPTSLCRNNNNDWWCCRFDVPQEAQNGAFAICGVFNGSESWDNNRGADYSMSVMSLEAAIVRAVASACIGLDVELQGSGQHFGHLMFA